MAMIPLTQSWCFSANLQFSAQGEQKYGNDITIKVLINANNVINTHLLSWTHCISDLWVVGAEVGVETPMPQPQTLAAKLH